jgi:hypothetical protein
MYLVIIKNMKGKLGTKRLNSLHQKLTADNHRYPLVDIIDVSKNDLLSGIQNHLRVK